MTHPWPPYPWPLPAPAAYPSLDLLMRRLTERAEATTTMLERIDRRLDRMDGRLEYGDERMDTICAELAAMKASHQASAAEMAALKSGKDAVPGWERIVKGLAPYLIAGATLAATGSIDAAVKLATGLGGIK